MQSVKSIKFTLKSVRVYIRRREHECGCIHVEARGQICVSFLKLQGSSFLLLFSIRITSTHPALHMDSQVLCGWDTPYQLSHPLPYCDF